MKSDTLNWVLLGASVALSVCLGLSRVRLWLACLLAAIGVAVSLAYDMHLHGLLPMGGLFHFLAGAAIPFLARRARERGSLLPKDPKQSVDNQESPR
jgi:hypothetical protein